MSDIVLPNLSFKIMGMLFKVQNELGPSLLEKYYQRAFEEELKFNNLIYKKELLVNLTYRGQNIGKYYLDFTVEDLVVVETKATQYYSPKFFNQALSYLQQINMPLAIIANFRGTQLRYKRIINPKYENDKTLNNKDERFE